MIKFLHTGDIHIGASFSSFNSDLHDRLREIQINAVINMVKVANMQKVDYVLLAGDLFDNHVVDLQTRENFFSILSSFDGKVFISAGNHDYYFKNSFWDKHKFPENIIFFNENTVTKYEMDDVCIFGASFSNIYDKIDISNIEFDANKLNIAVLHADIMTKSQYNTYTKADIAQTGFDYMAFGHNHVFSEILKAENTYYSSSGCISSAGFDETGVKGFVIGEISKESKSFSFYESGGLYVLKESLDISQITSFDMLCDEITKKSKENIFLDLTLTGVKYFDIDIKKLKEILSNSFFSLNIIDLSSKAEDLWKYIGDESLVGEFTRSMYKKYSQNPSAEIIYALKIGIDALLN